ncbi:unnamed protein product [Dibothriocephalus latus]|uniref:Uncharacterized protein n=1 Tax=Dibothriocephalus latus TaxID=60516 RepID=A0A3P7N4V5_DIBLA|nr:unnamed protein product [Dibothriocephalus latus]
MDNHWERRIERACAVNGTIGPEGGRWGQTVAGTLRVLMRLNYCNNKQGCNPAPRSIAQACLIITLILLSSAFVRILTH